VLSILSGRIIKSDFIGHDFIMIKVYHTRKELAAEGQDNLIIWTEKSYV